MNQQLWWYVARSTGIVAWALVAAAVIWGLLLTTRLLGGRSAPKWLLDLHRFLGGLAVIFTGLHLVGLVADSYTHFGPVDLLVPLASAWKPAPVALGVVAMYLLLAVELTSLAMRRLPRRLWRWVHLTSFGSFWLATLHGVLAGTDASNPVLWVAYLATATTVLFLTLFRTLADPRTPGRGSRRGVEARKPAGVEPERKAPRQVDPRHRSGGHVVGVDHR